MGIVERLVAEVAREEEIESSIISLPDTGSLQDTGSAPAARSAKFNPQKKIRMPATAGKSLTRIPFFPPYATPHCC